MRTEVTSFYSDGLKLSAGFYFPEDEQRETGALVIPCSGFTGLRHIHPARFARQLTRFGYACFSFDYRGFAESEGERGRVLLEEQVRDIVNAIAFAIGDERVDGTRIVLLGWGMAGGLIIEAARRMTGVAGLIAVNGFYNGARVQRHHRGRDGYESFVAAVEQKQRHRARTGEIERTDPFDLYPLDPQSRRYVDEILRKTPQYDAEAYSWELAESLLAWEVESRARSLRVPLLVAHGEKNELHPVREAESLYGDYAGPRTLHWIKDAGHTEFMHDDDARFLALARRIVEWLDDLLRQ